ncbi:hypothetical protein GCM10025864_33170 [Luteimicrobium album]|uniref:Uncharacterized protein n=1 Tax=Luteimicrobium album TaxID=1054550 RepID=A0ABQ6I479_9MICO|nr:hypothetical protein GCM10025864_33170 [Luteimicrobium album]
MLVVDALASLDGDRDPVGASRLDGARDDPGEQLTLPRERTATATLGDLGHGAAEVEVDVVGEALGGQEPDGARDRRRVDAVHLGGARRLALVERDDPQGGGVPLDERPARDHLRDVQARAVLAAQRPERLVRHAGHGCEHDRRVDRVRPDA